MAKDDAYVNQTGTELEILQTIEKAWKRNNPNEEKRNTTKSLDWFRKYVGRSFNRVGTGTMFRDRKMWKSQMTIGKMYFFEYLAKHRDTLPLWDRYPLIFPFTAYKAKDGAEIVVGLNMHYLPPALRMVAFRALLKLRTEKRYRKSTKLDMEWSLLKNMAESKYFAHAVHAYRLDHVKSVFVEVPAQAWEVALYLPTERFVGAGKTAAWKMNK
jgi:hypothetical protein